MSNITNHYAEGSCVFMAGSSQNGDVHITGPIYQGGSVPETPLQMEIKEPANDGVTNRDAIPADCVEAVKKVIVPTFTIEGGVVLNSATQIAKAAKQIDLGSNSQVAMLMAIGMEVNAVRPGCTCPDFVRALIGMRVIAYTNNKAIDTMAGGISKKLYGYKKGEKEYPPLSGNHQRWSTNDQPIGIRLFDAMRSQG